MRTMPTRPLLLALCALALLPAAALVLRAMPLSAAGLGGPLRCNGSTGIQVQNLDLEDHAELDVYFYAQESGGAPFRYHSSELGPGRAGNVYLPLVEGLKSGIYSAISYTGRASSAIVRTDWFCSGAAALYSDVQVGTEIAVPLALIDYATQRSHVTIQNAGGAEGEPSEVEILLYAAGRPEPVARELREIPGGASETLVLGVDAFEEVDPNTPQGFLGSLHLRAAVDIGAMSYVSVESSDKAVYAFEGQPIEAAAERLYAPLIRRQYYGYDTGISVMNPGEGDVRVTVTYHGVAGSCAGRKTEHGPVTIPPRGIHAFYQGPVPENGLPDGCVGTAVIDAEGGGVLAIVNDSLNFTEQSAAYNAVSEERASDAYSLPLVRNGHIAGLSMSTGIQVMNISETETAYASVTAFDQNGREMDGCGAACSFSLRPFQAVTIYPRGNTGIVPLGSYGSAWISSTEPVAVIVNDASAFGLVDAAIYNAIPLGLEDASPIVRIPYASR